MTREMGSPGEPNETRNAVADEATERSRDVLLKTMEPFLKRLTDDAGMEAGSVSPVMERVGGGDIGAFEGVMEKGVSHYLPDAEKAWRLTVGDVVFVFNAIPRGDRDSWTEFRGEFFRTDASGNPVESLGGNHDFSASEIASNFRSFVTPISLKSQ